MSRRKCCCGGCVCPCNGDPPGSAVLTISGAGAGVYCSDCSMMNTSYLMEELGCQTSPNNFGTGQPSALVPYNSRPCCQWQADIRGLGMAVCNCILEQVDAFIVHGNDGTWALVVQVFGQDIGSLSPYLWVWYEIYDSKPDCTILTKTPHTIIVGGYSTEFVFDTECDVSSATVEFSHP